MKCELYIFSEFVFHTDYRRSMRVGILLDKINQLTLLTIYRQYHTTEFAVQFSLLSDLDAQLKPYARNIQHLCRIAGQKTFPQIDPAEPIFNEENKNARKKKNYINFSLRMLRKSGAIRMWR